MDNLENQAIILGAKLADIAIRNTTDTIMNKISASKAGGKMIKKLLLCLRKLLINYLKIKMN